MSMAMFARPHGVSSQAGPKLPPTVCRPTLDDSDDRSPSPLQSLER